MKPQLKIRGSIRLLVPSSRLFESCKTDATAAERRYRRFYANVSSCLRRLEKLER